MRGVCSPHVCRAVHEPCPKEFRAPAASSADTRNSLFRVAAPTPPRLGAKGTGTADEMGSAELADGRFLSLCALESLLAHARSVTDSPRRAPLS